MMSFVRDLNISGSTGMTETKDPVDSLPTPLRPAHSKSNVPFSILTRIVDGDRPARSIEHNHWIISNVTIIFFSTILSVYVEVISEYDICVQ